MTETYTAIKLFWSLKDIIGVNEVWEIGGSWDEAGVPENQEIDLPYASFILNNIQLYGC